MSSRTADCRPDRRRSVSRQVAAAIRVELGQGSGARSKGQSERSLVERFGICRATAREAVHIAAAKHVRDPALEEDGKGAACLNLLEALRAVTRAEAAIAASRATVGQLHQLAADADALVQAAGSHTGRPSLKLNFQRHFWDAVGNEPMKAIAMGWRFPRLDGRDRPLPHEIDRP
jgi:DNA-binding FadR family transcriptional regulator